MIRFECPHCNQPVEVGDEFAGRKGRCPGCESVVEIPVLVRPQGAQPAGPDAPDRGGESLLADDLGGRGPRKLTLPESVATVTTEQPVRRMASVGRPMAVAGLILGFIPLLIYPAIFDSISRNACIDRPVSGSVGIYRWTPPPSQQIRARLSSSATAQTPKPRPTTASCCRPSLTTSRRRSKRSRLVRP